MSENEKVFDTVSNVGIEFLIRESFLGYKYRKNRGILYDADSEIPTKLISLYYGLKPEELSFNIMKKAFIKHYITNESEIEQVKNAKIHTTEEVKGLAAMYEYIHSDDINYLFDVYTLKDLHRKLFAYAAHPECAGEFRNFDVFLPNTGTDLCPWYMIRQELNRIDEEVQKLLKISPMIRNHDSMPELFAYIDRCIEINCELIKVHPFSDGNGRTVRGFINKLFEDAGLPPVYIKANERTEYHKAMNLANNEGDLTAIKQFYRYKICDSIIELDINGRLKGKKIQDDTGDKRRGSYS